MLISFINIISKQLQLYQYNHLYQQCRGGYLPVEVLLPLFLLHLQRETASQDALQYYW